MRQKQCLSWKPKLVQPQGGTSRYLPPDTKRRPREAQALNEGRGCTLAPVHGKPSILTSATDAKYPSAIPLAFITMAIMCSVFLSALDQVRSSPTKRQRLDIRAATLTNCATYRRSLVQPFPKSPMNSTTSARYHGLGGESGPTGNDYLISATQF